jgi:hypothetical protein
LAIATEAVDFTLNGNVSEGYFNSFMNEGRLLCLERIIGHAIKNGGGDTSKTKY